SREPTCAANSGLGGLFCSAATRASSVCKSFRSPVMSRLACANSGSRASRWAICCQAKKPAPANSARTARAKNTGNRARLRDGGGPAEAGVDRFPISLNRNPRKRARQYAFATLPDRLRCGNKVQNGVLIRCAGNSKASERQWCQCFGRCRADAEGDQPHAFLNQICLGNRCQKRLRASRRKQQNAVERAVAQRFLRNSRQLRNR